MRFLMESLIWDQGGNPTVVLNDDDAWFEALTRAKTLYSDGGVWAPRTCWAGSWAWVAADADDAMIASQQGWVESYPQERVTNNAMEFVAMLRALEELTKVQPGADVRMCSDSAVTIGRFRDDWALRGVPPSWVERMHRVWSLAGHIEYVLMKGHPIRAEVAAGVGTRGGRTYPVSAHQVHCDALCTEMITRWGIERGVTR